MPKLTARVAPAVVVAVAERREERGRMAEHDRERVPERMLIRGWHSRAVELAHMLVVPQGFTVAVAGSIAVCVGRHGFAGPFAVWLFVVGACVGYCLVIVGVGAVRRPIEQPGGIVGAALLNVAALVVVPVVTLVNWWITDADVAYFVTGLAVHLTYIPTAAATLVLLGRLGPSGRRPGRAFS